MQRGGQRNVVADTQAGQPISARPATAPSCAQGQGGIRPKLAQDLIAAGNLMTKDGKIHVPYGERCDEWRSGLWYVQQAIAQVGGPRKILRLLNGISLWSLNKVSEKNDGLKCSADIRYGVSALNAIFVHLAVHSAGGAILWAENVIFQYPNMRFSLNFFYLLIYDSVAAQCVVGVKPFIPQALSQLDLCRARVFKAL